MKLNNIAKTNNISIEHIPTGIDSVSIIFKSKIKDEVLEQIQNDLIEEIIPDKMQIIFRKYQGIPGSTY